MNTIKKLFLVVTGTIIASFGMDLGIHAGFGGATLAVLWDGVSRTFSITVGQASLIIAGIMILFCFFYDREQVNWGTLLYQILYSSFLDIFRPLLRYPEHPVPRFLLMVLGIAIFAVGSGFYAYANFGRGAYDALTFALHRKNGWQPRYVRIVLDVIWVVSGALLGGKFGLCTLVTIALSGFLLQKTVETLKKIHFLRLS